MWIGWPLISSSSYWVPLVSTTSVPNTALSPSTPFMHQSFRLMRLCDRVFSHFVSRFTVDVERAAHLGAKLHSQAQIVAICGAQMQQTADGGQIDLIQEWETSTL